MLIGLNGQIGSGKDTFFERAVALADQLPGTATPERRAFADKLKDAFGALFGIDRTAIEMLKRNDDAVAVIMHRTETGSLVPISLTDDFEPLSQFTIRLGLQRMGTEVGRDLFGETFWVDQCVPLTLDHRDQLIMVTDCRFPNEARRIREAGGFVVRVLNGPLLTDAGHASEQILDIELIDFEVDNSVRGDDFANLDRQVLEVLHSIPQLERVRQHTPTVRSVSSELEGPAPVVTRLPDPAGHAR